MACPPSALLLPLAIFLGIAGVLSDDDPAKWSQRSASNNGWVPIETPCESCRNAAEDQDIQASGGFASAALPPQQPQAPSLIWTDTGELRPPPAPIRIQRQEGGAAPLRPLSDTYFTDQRPPPPPVPKGVKSQRDHRFLFNQNLPKQQQFSYIPENQHRLQQNRVVFPSSQVHSQFSDLQTANLQLGGQNGAFFGQQFRPEITASQQQQLSLRQQQHQPNKQVQIQQQELQQNLQLQNPQKQAKFQSIPHDQFPLIFPPGGLGPPHGFQNPQLQILPVPHSAQPSASQVDLQSVLQHQLQNQIHHQINQQLLGASFVAPLTQFPPSALGHQLQIPIRNPAISPANLQLIPQKQNLQQTHQPLQQTSQPSHPFQSAQKVNQQLELTPSKKLTPTIPPKIETTTISQESTKNAVGSNPEEEVEEEVQLLYVPVEALRQRDRINKEIIQGQTPSVTNRNQPERQTSHSFQINHYQENRPLTQNSGQFQENAGIAQASFDHVQTKFPTGKDVSNEKERFQNQGFRADQGSASVLREEKHPFAFSPPPPQQFHENIQLEGPRQIINQGEEGAKLFQDSRYHLENLQQEEQQRAVSQQQIHNVRVTTPQYETYSTSRKPSRIQEQNSQRIYQGPGGNIGQSFPSHTTTRPSSTTQNQPVPTTQSTQPYVSSTPAPHQPPLSVYMEDIVGQGVSRLSVDDVLRSLNGASTIPVLERPGHRPPRVFVGPSAIRPPQGYAKFELPYLSMLDTNRVERKIDRLPFFVAPLSFQPPPGYAKIPFPAPHVGSVVVSSTPVQSTTESVFSDEKPQTTSVLPQLVNSLQLPNASPGEGILHSSLNADVGNVPITSSQRPPLQQVHRQRPQHQQPQRQQFTQHQVHNQESISQGHLQQPLHEHQNVHQYFGQQPFFEQQFVQQQELQQQLFQPQGPEEQVIQHQILSQENSGQRQQPQQYQEPQQPSYVLYKTDPPPQIIDYTTSSTPPTTTTTTTTTTLAPQTRAPTPHRGRNRHRPSYSQNTDSDYSYRGRGSFRGSSQGETTRQPSTRTRRPWDGRRRPTTSTTEQSTSPEDTSYDSSFNPVSPPNQIVSSTVSNIDQQKDSNARQNPNIVTQSTIEQQQYVKDDPYSQSSLIDGVSQDGHLHSQGAFVLSAFQHPQVLGDVINGQISRPESSSSFTGIYDGQKGNIGHTFEVISTDDQSSIQVQGPSPPRQHQIISHAGSPEVGFNSNKDTNIPLQNRDVVRNQNLEGGRNNLPGRASNSRGQHNIQQYRQQESPVTTAQNFFQGEIRTVTPDTLEQYQNTGLPGPNRNNGAALRNYNQQPNSIQASVQNVPAQQIFPTQFTPSIEISEEPIHEQSTKHPEVSNSQGSHHPQLFVISTPIPNPIQFVNRTYLNPPTLENPLPIYQSQVYQPQTNPVEERRPVAEVVNQGLSSFSGHQENTAQNFQISSNQQGQLVEHIQPQFQSGHQANVKEQPIEDIQPEGEPKRTRFRQPQKVLAGTQSTKHSESSDDIEEPRPRYRQQFKGNVESTRGRQQVQRVRGRFHTTESPSDEESSVPHRSQSFLNQRFRGRQRTSGSTSSQETAQYSDSQGVDHISQKLNYPTQAPQTTFPTEIEDHSISIPQVEHVSESHKADGDISDVDKPQIPGEHLKKPDRGQLSNAPGHHVQTQEFERPANVRSRGRFRGGGERTGNRIRGQGSSLNSQDSSSDAEAQNRYQFQGQRYQQIPRRTPVPENIQEEPQRQFQEDSEKVALSFDSLQNKAPLYQKNEDGNINTGSPILISNAGFNTDSIGLNPVLSQPGIPSGDQATVDQYEQNIPSIENQESPVAPIVTTEPTTTTVGSVKPGRKYGNFATRGLPRRPSHSTVPLNAVPSTTSAPETSQPQKVYTVRPARRPVPKTPVNTRGRIRKPTTPTTTTTSTTESPYFLTTSAPVETQAEYSPYDQSTSFGAIRGNFRNRKRPVTVGRRPKPSSSNEVQQEEQEDDSPRLQNSYRQRSRGSSRRVSTVPPERSAIQWRQPEEEQSEPAQIPDSSQGFKAAKSSGNVDYYVASQHNLQPSDFQISLSEEALSSETAPRKLNIPGKINNAGPRPVYRHDEQYFSQESQQQEEIHEPRLKYQNPPNRSPTTITQNESEYVYEESNPSFTKTTQQKLPTEEAAIGTAGIQPKEVYENQQQDFVINFGGLNTAENSGFIKRDELDSGEETRYFDMSLSNPLKLHGKIPADNEKYTEIRDVPFETNPEIVESQEASDSIDESTNVSEDSKPQTNPRVEEESMEKELKENPIGSEDNVEDLPAKKVSGRRRGNWVRVRTKGQRRRPGDMLETAESQNLATVSQNLLQFTTPLKAKAATPSVELPITEETPMEKDEEQVPNEDTHTGESFDEEAVDVFSDEETSDLNQEEGFEIEEQPAEEILEVESDEESSTEKDEGETKSDLEDLTVEEEPSSSNKSSSNADEVAKDNENLVLDSDENNLAEEENDIFDNAERKITQGESSTESAEKYANNGDEIIDVTTEEPSEATTEFPTPRVLGTSTTTEISLETEICYRGRCVKTKVDADQVPIE